MIEDTKNIAILSRQTNATTRRIKVRLDKIVFDAERYCHRDPDALKPDPLEKLMNSLTVEGQQVPIEGFFNERDNFVLLKGHRRTTASRFLAGKNVPNFALNMEMDAIEVLNASPVDRLIRSVSDNEVRLNLDRIGRIRVAKKLFDAGVQVERAALAMNVSPKTYERDLSIARNGWMFQHVIDQSIAPTHACALIETAEKAGRLPEMKEDLDAFIAAKKLIVREKEKLSKARDGKDLPPAEKHIKNRLSNELVKHWVELLKQGKRFDEDAKWNFSAGIKAETEQLHISAVNLDLSKASLDKLAKVAGKLSLLTKQMVPYLKKAHEKESGEGAPDVVEAAYDIEFLRELGLEKTAKDLEAETQLSKEPDGEESPQDQPAERQEKDLTADVQLPASDGVESPQEQPTERQEQDLTADVQLPPTANNDSQNDATKKE